MAQLINGKTIAECVKDEIAQKIHKLQGPRPNLAIILVGERADSELYVSLKEREGRKIGIDIHLYKLTSQITEEELLATISFLNQDPLIDGILVQLPLPTQFQTSKIMATLDPQKDVDGFHSAHPDYIVSPVLAAIQACLSEINFIPNGKTANVLYNSQIFGQNVQQLLTDYGVKTIWHNSMQSADLLISALGKPQTIKSNRINDGAVVIDIGITKQGNQVFGDIDFAEIQSKASYITPVPGGIGPMTIAFLFKNIWEIFNRKNH